MTLQVDSWAVAGATSSEQIARLNQQAATRSGNGVLGSGDLRVSELTVPGGAVDVAAGGFVALGQEETFQGSYFGYNVGSAEVAINPTAGAVRSDLVILRVEDPNIDGTPWGHNPATDNVYYFRVIEGVSGTETELPANTTGVVLARIDMPANTAAVEQAYITDLREMMDARRQRTLRVQRGGTKSNGVDWDEAGNIVDPDFERWPQHDWTVTIPSWATQVQVLADWDNAFLKPTGSTAGTEDARGQLWIGLLGTEEVTTTPSAYNFNQTSTTNGYRCSASNKDQIDIPAALRGQTVDVRMYVMGTAGQNGRLVADEWANFSVDLEFLEVPAPEASL
ncbi:hypothetical protein GCM10023224_05000 [Streptomonospora halophila]|uniref:Minor tail protein n=1 Tax=Streptomonospora halophila TaxID=427369 RepID=A0ABP9G540_9ACTN